MKSTQCSFQGATTELFEKKHLGSMIKDLRRRGRRSKDTRETSLKTSQRCCNNSRLDKGAMSQEKAANTEEDKNTPNSVFGSVLLKVGAYF